MFEVDKNYRFATEILLIHYRDQAAFGWNEPQDHLNTTTVWTPLMDQDLKDIWDGVQAPNERTDFTGGSPIVYGDLGQDGSFGVEDLNLLIDIILGRTSPPALGSPAFIAGDVDADDSLGMGDLNLYVDMILGRITQFPAELNP